MHQPLQIAIIGMGGFAGTHHDAVVRLEAEGVCRLICTCDPSMGRFEERQRLLNFAGRGVRLFTDYEAMLDNCGPDLDVVTIPTPIPLHAPMHHACVERGLAVYLEKPPTLDYEELNAMLAVEAHAVKATQVGFNFIVEESRQALKQRMVDGEFGKLRCVSVFGRWPRKTSYFQRAKWAGALMLDHRLVLDSCMGNALAHYVHNGLFWAGERDPWSWGTVEWVESELYRVHRIGGTDTIFVRAGIAGGAELRLAMSHACAGEERHYERVTCDDAEITYVARTPNIAGPVRIRWRDGREESIPAQGANIVINLRAYCAYLRGELPRPMTRLEDCRPFVEINNLAYIAAGHIATVKPPFCEALADDYLTLVGVDEALEGFSTTGVFPSGRRLPWAVPGGGATRDDLPRLSQVVRRMVEEAAVQQGT